MTEDPSLELQDKRWKNAVQLTKTFVKYCLDNELAFFLENDSQLLYPSQVEITDTEINIVITHNNSKTIYNLYINDVDMDHGVHETTYNWYAKNSLFNATLVKIVSHSNFHNIFKIVEDDVTQYLQHSLYKI